MGFLYVLAFLKSEKLYVGVTCGSLRKRLARHRYDAKNDKAHCYLLARAWRKYGEPVCLELGQLPEDQLALAEIEMIAALNTLAPFGYNVSPGGSVVTKEMIQKRKTSRGKVIITAEQRARISATLKRANAEGALPVRLPFTDERRANMAAAQRAYAQTPAGLARRQRMSTRQRSTKPAESTRLKMSQSNKKRWAAYTNEQRAAVGAAISKGRHAAS